MGPSFSTVHKQLRKMLNSRLKLVLILALQIIAFFVDYPNKHTQQVEITIKTRPCVESKTSSLDLLCKLVINDLKEIYDKSAQQCPMAFAMMRRLCTDHISGKYDGIIHMFIPIVLEIILNCDTAIEKSNHEQNPT